MSPQEFDAYIKRTGFDARITAALAEPIEPFRDALAAAVEATGHAQFPDEPHIPTNCADAIIAALPPEWRDFLAAREPLLALVADYEVLEVALMRVLQLSHDHYGPPYREGQFPCAGCQAADDAHALLRRTADPAIVKLREAEQP